MKMEKQTGNKNINLQPMVGTPGRGKRDDLINQVKNIAEIMLSVGDLQKAKILSLAVNRLEQLEMVRAGRRSQTMSAPVFID